MKSKNLEDSFFDINIVFSNEIKTLAKESKWPEVYEICERFISFLKFTKEDALNLLLVIEEIFINIAKYAYTNGCGYIYLSTKYFSDSKMIQIKFEDEGVPFDPTLKPLPNLKASAAERRIGGLGIYMVSKIMDTMKYSYENGKNKFLVTKKINNRRLTEMGVVNLTKNREDVKVNYKLEGRVDTQSAPDLQDELDICFKESEENYGNKIELILDFQGVEYLSSAGLRTILYAKKRIDAMNEGSSFEIINVQPQVMEVFNMTGFNDFLTLSGI